METVREEAWSVASPQQRQQTPAPQQQQQNGRIDLKELKAHMEKRLGPDRSQRYFSNLNGYLSQRLSKTDFDKLCVQTLGRENLQLHNRLIRSILYNAYQAKCPPPPPDVGRSMVASTKKVPQAAEVFNTCNGDVSLLQVQGSRTMGTAQDCPLKDQMNNIGPNGRMEAAVNHTQVSHGVSAAPENGTLSSLELKRLVHFQQCEPAEPLAKHPRVDKLPLDNMLLQRRSMSSGTDCSAEMLQSPVRAPLGIPFCSASVGGARKLPPPPVSAGEDHLNSCVDHGRLFNAEVLHRRMEKAAETLGLAGVTMDCAELLNSGLDKYLKNLIKSSVELTGASVQKDARKGMLYKQQAYGKQINGVRLPNHVHMHSGSGPSGAVNEIRSNHLISVNDFKVAMQLNPQQLGEDWPIFLEKISLRSLEEND
uniref:Transcriptional coactivator Hfi1/Transcriptional adapter 1 n=1 Tax=Arundo donax TaxID=35708 RepID=A0A0A9DP08_ARUDO